MFCKHCGSPVNDEAKFCVQCGEVVAAKLPAPWGKRLANYLIDYFIVTIVTMALMFSSSESLWHTILAILATPIYYLFFESIWQRTPSKWITKTKVVRLDGTKPRFLQILGRTLSRLVPFEQLSFLVNKHPMGWHDRWPRTLVVPANYTPADVAEIDVQQAKKGSSSTIAIIVILLAGFFIMMGIIASVVLASLNSAREKALQEQGTGQIELYQDQTLPVGSIGGEAYE